AWDHARGASLSEYTPTAVPSGPDLSRIPLTVGPAVEPPLVADLDGDGKPEVVLYRNGRVTLYQYGGERGFAETVAYPSDGAPAIADLDGDGKLALILGSASTTSDPVIRAIQPGKEGRKLWEVTLPRPARPGLPYGRSLYFQTGQFTGRK